MTSKALVISPRTRELEKVIERGIASFVEVGNALLAIREERRYREGGFDSFDAYCRERWSMASSQARGFIREAKAVEEIASQSVDMSTLPANARQAREIAAVPQGERAEVWAEVVEQHDPEEITAAVIREHVEARATTTTTNGPATLVVVDCSAVTSAVRAARRAGATSQEIYAAYQAGLH